MSQNTIIAEKLNFKVEVLVKKPMWHESVFFLSGKILNTGCIPFSVHL